MIFRRRAGEGEGEARPAIFYGWWLVGGALILGLLNSGLYFQAFSSFIEPLGESFGAGRGVILLAFSLANLGEPVIGPIQGMLVDRYGPRWVMLFGVTLAGLGFVLSSFAGSITVFIVIFAPLVAVGQSMGLLQPAVTTVSKWFVRKRGQALGYTFTGFALGGALVPLVEYSIHALGWRHTFLAIGITMWALGYPIALMMRKRPEHYGLLPDGDASPAHAAAAVKASGRTVTEIDFTLKEAIRSRAFWILGTAFALRMFVVASITGHFIPMMGEKGISSGTAATLLLVFSAVTIPSRLIFGYLADRYSKIRLMEILMVVMIGSLLVLNFSSATWHVAVFIIIYGITWGGSGASLIMAIRAEFFGRKNFGTIAGASSLLNLGGTVAGPIVVAIIFDAKGDYVFVWQLYVMIAGLSTFVMFFAKRPYPKRPLAQTT